MAADDYDELKLLAAVHDLRSRATEIIEEIDVELVILDVKRGTEGLMELLGKASGLLQVQTKLILALSNERIQYREQYLAEMATLSKQLQELQALASKNQK